MLVSLNWIREPGFPTAMIQALVIPPFMSLYFCHSKVDLLFVTFSDFKCSMKFLGFLVAFHFQLNYLALLLMSSSHPPCIILMACFFLLLLQICFFFFSEKCKPWFWLLKLFPIYFWSFKFLIFPHSSNFFVCNIVSTVTIAVPKLC